jgi:hypothetical protein
LARSEAPIVAGAGWQAAACGLGQVDAELRGALPDRSERDVRGAVEHGGTHAYERRVADAFEDGLSAQVRPPRFATAGLVGVAFDSEPAAVGCGKDEVDAVPAESVLDVRVQSPGLQHLQHGTFDVVVAAAGLGIEIDSGRFRFGGDGVGEQPSARVVSRERR